MFVRLLGPVGVIRDGEELDLGGRKPRTLFALLAAHAPDRVSVDHCLQAIWGEDASPGVKRSLQTYVSSLRNVIDPDRLGILEGSEDGYRLNPSDGSDVDVAVFRRLAAEGDFAGALALWDQPLGELATDEWAQPFLREWEGARLAATEAWIAQRLETGDAADTIADLEELVENHPMHEPFWGQLMLALYRADRQADALRAFGRVKEVLGEELGIVPSQALVNLEERILLQDPGLMPAAEVPSNLPAPLDDIVGREDELDAVAERIGANRLVTITGTGGTGKTTLALEVSRRLRPEFAEGCWWVELAPLTDPARIATELLGVMRLAAPVDRDHLDALAERIGNRTVLLVIDNCEHLLGAVAAVAYQLLTACPNLKVLATSREALAVQGETAWRLPPLAVPGEDAADVAAFPAVQLFTQRAQRADQEFRLDEGNEQTVARIVRRLDGLPFAIELAAARLRSMGVADVERRLDDRFRLLTGGVRTEVPHHQTLRGTVDWSYDLLSNDAQRTYRRISLFQNGFDLAAAQAVVDGDGDVLDDLDQLVAQSLLTADRGAADTRYQMLETVRHHGLELLERAGELGETRAAHLGWLGGLVREGARQIEGAEQATWLKRFRAETDNIRTALGYALDNDPVTGCLIASGLARFWWMYASEADASTLSDARSFLQEGYDYATALLAAAGTELPVKVRARLQMGIGGLLCIRLGRFSEAIERLDEANALFAEFEDVRGQAWATFYRSLAAWGEEPFDSVVESFKRSRELHIVAEDRFGIAFSGLLYGHALALAGDSDAARPLLEQFDAAARKVGVPSLVAHGADSKAFIDAWERKVTAESVAWCIEGLERFRDLNNFGCLTHALGHAGMVFTALNMMEECAKAFGVIQTLLGRISMAVAPYEDRTGHVRQMAGDRFDEELWESGVAAGAALGASGGIAWVLENLRSLEV